MHAILGVKMSVDLEEKYAFVKEIPAEFICLICSKLLRNPHVTECCGQHYCRYCLEKWLQKNVKKPCPFCRTENCNHMCYLPMKRDIDELEVYCVNREKGCETTSMLKVIEDHIKRCEFESGTCKHRCGASLLRKEIKEHERNECPNRIVRCQYCQETGQFKSITTSVHQARCQNFPIDCPNGCEASGITKRNLSQHRKKCPLELIECSYSNVGCHEKIHRKDYKSHQTENMKKHLQLITESFSQLLVESERLKENNSRLKKENTEFEKKNAWRLEMKKAQCCELEEENSCLRREIKELKRAARHGSAATG